MWPSCSALRLRSPTSLVRAHGGGGGSGGRSAAARMEMEWNERLRAWRIRCLFSSESREPVAKTSSAVDLLHAS